MNKILRNLLAIISICLISACANDKSLDKDANLSATEIYNQAMASMEQGYYKRAKEKFAKVNQDFPYAKEAQKAQYLEAFAEYKLKNYDSAVMSFDEYIQLYPAGEDIESAYYLKAMSYYDQIVEVRLDQNIAEKALEALKDILVRFPKGKYTQDINLKIDLVNDQLAGREMGIGRFYQKRGIVNGAITRYQNVVENYPTTTYIEEALYRLTESFLTLGLTTEAKKYASILGNNYPSGEWYRKSYNLLKIHEK